MFSFRFHLPPYVLLRRATLFRAQDIQVRLARLQSNKDQVVALENANLIYNDLSSNNKYITYLDNEKHTVFYGNNNNVERKKEIAEYIRIYLRGGSKWKKIWKEII